MAARLLAALCLVLAAALPARAQFQTTAEAAYAYDMTTGTVLLEKNADTPMPPASMSKLMTLYMVFEAVRDGRLTLDERLPVSEHAMSFGGSTMFLDTTDRVSVEDLIRGIIVLSGNDACVVLAEALSPDGTEPGFARMMTERARQMGMTQSTFRNSTGWPADGHEMSMRDLGIIATRLIEDFPTYYPLFAETEFLFDGRAPRNRFNRNPLLTLDIGADGLKTGHTQEAGYGLTGSAKQGDRRIVFVLTGMDSTQTRAAEAERLVNWAFRQFAETTLLDAGERLGEAPVWLGAERAVGIVAAQDVRLLMPALTSGPVAGEVVYSSPLRAPIAAGDHVADLVVRRDGLPDARIPLVADGNVARGGFGPRMRTAAKVLATQLAGEARNLF